MSEIRLPCRCFAVPREGGLYVVVATAFLCPDKHHQRDTVTPEDVARLQALADAEHVP